MDVLKTLAFPPSVEHYHLLLLIGALISIVFYPYFGFLLGSSFFSYRYERKGRKEGNALYVRLAKDLIGTALYNKTLPTFLALIPAFSMIFVYAQLLQTTESIAVSLAAVGFVLLLIALAFLYAYKYTFRLEDILEGYRDALTVGKGSSEKLDDIEHYSEENVRSHLRFGRNGLIFIVLATFFMASSIVAAADTDNWVRVGSIPDLFILPDMYVRFLQFIALAAGATGVGILFFLFWWKKDQPPLDETYAHLVRSLSIRLVVGSLMALPALVLTGFFLLPGQSLSGTLFAVAGLGLALLFLSAQFVYAYAKEPHPHHTASALFIFAFALALFGANDQVALYNATKGQAALLSYRHDLETEDIRAKLGVAAVALTGEDIYNGRCSACHLFDQKKIGPAYKDVIPKYAGNKEKIMAFVLNPAKMNPAFPPMPNQGLKPAEADSIVSYILRTLGKGAAKSPVPTQAVTRK
jgi:cytochrome c